MPKAKTSTKEIVINVVLLVVTAAVIMWRYDNCKKKEAQAEKDAEKARVAEVKAGQKRVNTCLSSVSSAELNDCIRCTCSECLDQFEDCAADKECKSMTVESVLADSGQKVDGKSDSISRIRFQQRAACMYSKCADSCRRKN